VVKKALSSRWTSSEAEFTMCKSISDPCYTFQQFCLDWIFSYSHSILCRGRLPLIPSVLCRQKGCFKGFSFCPRKEFLCLLQLWSFVLVHHVSIVSFYVHHSLAIYIRAYTIPIKFGDKEQQFSLQVDTGSSDLVSLSVCPGHPPLTHFSPSGFLQRRVQL